jgi:hypothetical protein
MPIFKPQAPIHSHPRFNPAEYNSFSSGILRQPTRLTAQPFDRCIVLFLVLLLLLVNL